MAKRVIIFDLEVLRGPEKVEGGWDNPEAMGFGTAVAYDSDARMYRFFGPDMKDKLIKLLSSADLVVGFNHMRFDYRVLFGNKFDYKSVYKKGKDCDLLVEVVRRKFDGCDWVEEAEDKYGSANVHNGSCGLNGLSKGTFGTRKSGHGANAPTLINEEKWAEVFEYNLQDVILTKNLYAHWIERKFVIDGKENIIRRF